MGKDNAEALELIRKLPEEVTTDAIMEEFYFERQIDTGCETRQKDVCRPIRSSKKESPDGANLLVADCK